MGKKKYDIFISYRRDGGAQYARIMQLMLIQRGYKVFLDYDELRDGTFNDRIKAAIKEAPIFMPVLSAGSMARCINEDDWLGKEIMLAVQEGKHFVPIDPDRTFDGVPKGVPTAIKEAIELNQHSEVSFGQLLGASIEQMISNRLIETIGRRTSQEKKDSDFDAAKETLRRMDAHNRFMKRLGILGVVAAILIVLATCVVYWCHTTGKEALAEKRTELQEKYKGFHLQLNTYLTMKQMETIDTMLTNMSEVYPDSVWMSQFEFTVGQWYAINNEPYDEELKNMPMTNVSFGDIYSFLVKLSDMTNLSMELPSVEVWEYAAHGGPNNETTTYVGDDDVDKVAWYKENSGGKAHPSDGQQGKGPNMLDLYDMSGNVSELCNSAFSPETDNSPYIVCGGNFTSPSSEVTATSRAPFDNNAKADTVGFRIVIRK